MKKLIYFLCTVAFCILFSCNDGNSTKIITYEINEPILMNATDFRKSIKVSTIPEQIKEQGKICYYEGYLYISEPEKGIHIIDNRNPSDPKNIGYIELTGNIDLAIRNNMLYADAFIDLVWFDVTNPAKPELKGRLEEVFTHALPVMDNNLGYDYNMCYTENKNKDIVIGWKVVKRTEKVTICNDCYYEDATSNKGNGANGSMSRFGIYKDNLYVVLNNYMSIFNLSGDNPTEVGEKIPVGWDVETIFSYKENLFLGTPRGMLIYSVENPLKPEYQSSLQHVYGCDPVVVENDLAYVTVRSGNFCGQNSNELFIVDVSDVKHPKQIVSYSMTNPKGLGIDNGTLFLCDDGLKIFKSDDPQKLMSNQLQHHKGMDGFDVIPSNNVLMMIADDGLYQYDYSDLKNIKQLSKLSIGK